MEEPKSEVDLDGSLGSIREWLKEPSGERDWTLFEIMDFCNTYFKDHIEGAEHAYTVSDATKKASDLIAFAAIVWLVGNLAGPLEGSTDEQRETVNRFNATYFVTTEMWKRCKQFIESINSPSYTVEEVMEQLRERVKET